MKTWIPVTAENSLINGRRATLHPDLWKRLRWETANYHSLPCGLVLKLQMRGGAIAHVISPDPLALALAPGERVFPNHIPSFNELPAISPTGFIWMLADPAPATPPPAPSSFADCIGA